MGSPITLSHLTFSDLEWSNSRVHRFRNIISRKGGDLGPMLLLNINRKPYMGSQMAVLNLTCGDLEGQSQGHSRFFMAGDLYGIHIFASRVLPS